MTARQPLRLFGQILALAAVYAVVGRLSLRLDPLVGFASLVWPPTGIALAALVAISPKLWPAIALGAFALNLSAGAPVGLALGIGVGSALEAFVGATVLRRTLGAGRAASAIFESVPRILVFAAIVASAPALSAVIGVSSLSLAHLVPRELVPRALETWWLGDGVGALVLTPVLLTWRLPSPLGRSRPVEAVALVLSTLALDGFVFGPLTPPGSVREFLVFPLFLWATIRFGPRGAALSSLATSAIAILGTASGTGPFVQATLAQGLLPLQSFIAVGTLMSLILAAALFERNRALEASQRAERRAAFVARGSGVMAESLSMDLTIDRITHLLVPELADWCTICVRAQGEGKEELQRIAAVHRDPAKAELMARYLKAFPPASHRGTGIFPPLESRAPVLSPVVTDEDLTRNAQSPEHLALMQKLGARSAILVPLIAREQLIGVVSLLRSTDIRRYTLEDLDLAADIAGRAALAIENARLYEASQEAIRAREELMAIVSHDLKNPLAAILSRAKLLERQPPPERASTWIAEQTDGIRRSAKQMNTLIERILDAEGAEDAAKGGLSIRSQRITAAALVQEAASAFEASSREGGSTLSVDLGSCGDIEVAADRARVFQILSNLIGNAFKFSPKPGAIRLSLSEADRELWFAVQDNGPGIAEPDQAHVFDRHWHGRGGGTGLGLFIVKQLVEAHGGKVRVDSGETGSRFSFSLPKADWGGCPATAPPLAPSKESSNHKT